MVWGNLLFWLWNSNLPRRYVSRMTLFLLKIGELVINIFYHLSSLLKLHQIIFIENQDEYSKIESFSCSYTHWNYFETIDEAKLFCSTDKSCFGITILKQSKHEDRFRPCTFPTRISSDESYDLFVKESNTGISKLECPVTYKHI